jgi:hypothetical protein
VRRYRIYIVSLGGRVVGPPTVIEAADDKLAVERARTLMAGHEIELWDDARLVGRFKA